MKKDYRITIEPLSSAAKAEGRTEIFECLSAVMGAVTYIEGEYLDGVSHFAGDYLRLSFRPLVHNMSNILRADLMDEIFRQVKREKNMGGVSTQDPRKCNMEKNYRITIEPLSAKAKANDYKRIYECLSFIMGVVIDVEDEHMYGISRFTGDNRRLSFRSFIQGMPNELRIDLMAEILRQTTAEKEKNKGVKL